MATWLDSRLPPSNSASTRIKIGTSGPLLWFSGSSGTHWEWAVEQLSTHDTEGLFKMTC